MTTDSSIPRVDNGAAPDYYNPAKDYEKLRAAMNDPLPFDGWPSRWRRCLAAEVVEQAETIIALRGHLEIARAALTARDQYAAQVRKVLEAHCLDLTECAKTFREAGMTPTADQTCLVVYELRELLEKEPK
jgi:hypothetical protein